MKTTLPLLLACLVALPAVAGGTSAERRNANRFILEKLNRETGDGWNRAGQFFLWTYKFSSDGCDLSIRREDVDGANIVKQAVPVSDVVPLWQGSGSLKLLCQSTTDCIELKVTGADKVEDSKRLGETALVVPMPDDLPKLNDAFAELHRLCDDAYRSER